MPRPATIRISVATIGWMPSTATRKPFHRPQTSPAPSAAASTSGTAMAVGEARSDRAADRHHRADREVDAAGRDHQRHAERQQRHRRAAIEHVDRRCRTAGRPARRRSKNCGRHDAVDREDDDAARAIWARPRRGRRVSCAGPLASLRHRPAIGRDDVGDVDRRRPCSSPTCARSRSTTTRSRIGHDLLELRGDARAAPARRRTARGSGG